MHKDIAESRNHCGRKQAKGVVSDIFGREAMCEETDQIKILPS